MVKSYNSETDKFNAFCGGIGGARGPVPKIISRKITDINVAQDTIIVKEKAIYYNQVVNDDNSLTYYVYSDVNKKNLLYKKTCKVDELYSPNKETVSINDYLNNASIITQTYKLNKETNSYYFVSSVIDNK